MNEVFLIIGLSAGVSILTTIITYNYCYRRPRWNIPSNETMTVGTSDVLPEYRQLPACHHCGATLNPEPNRGVSTEEKTLLVYVCDACKKETHL